MIDLTICYVVGGHQVHYDNLKRSMDSIMRSEFNGEFLVLEAGNKLKSDPWMTVINKPDLIDFNKGKVGYQFWRQKYEVVRQITTDYGMYVDTDTVLVNNNFQILFDRIGSKMGVCQHFWVPDCSTFKNLSVPKANLQQFEKVQTQLGMQDSDRIFVGGVFLFENNEKNNQIFEDTLKIYDEIYTKDKEYVRGITDEIFFSVILQRANSFYPLNGAVNHCFMGEKFMPLTLQDGRIYGKNPNDSEYEMVTFLHCDISRRDPSKEYDGELKAEIQEIIGKI